jgi:hypothetical protein
MFGRSYDFDGISNLSVGANGDFLVWALSPLDLEIPTAPLKPLATASAATPTYSLTSDIAAHEAAGALTFAGARAVLQDAAAQPMTATLFAGLQAAAMAINAPGGPTATVYVRQMVDNVVLGDSANAAWNGGAAVATALGDLSATSTATQFDELIGKWFLGTDMPGDAPAPGQGSSGVAYQTYALPLFARGGPQPTDVNQGQIGDCWLLAALAETAMLDPSLIENMIVARGASFRFKFWVDGRPDFVTVNNALPTYVDGAVQWDGSAQAGANSTTSLWVPLTEKALAQLSGQTGIVTGMEYQGGQNQYYELDAGAGEGVSLITGQPTANFDLGGLSSGALTSLLGQMQTALANHQDVLLGTSDMPVSGDLVAGHMFAVTGVDAAAGRVSLYNPWGANAVGAGDPDSFVIAASALQADDASVFMALGAAKAA